MAKQTISLLPPGSGPAKGTGKTLTLRIEHDLCYGREHEVVDAVRYMCGLAPAKIIVDLVGAKIVDSSGLRALLICQRLCGDTGIEFGLANICDCVARSIRLSGLSEVFGLPRLDVTADQHRPGVRLGAAVWRTYEHVAASNPAVISVLRDRAIAAAAEAGADPKELCDILIAVGEALTNAFRHGSPRKGVSKIELRCMSCSAAFVVEIQDEGAPFDPNATPAPDPKKLKDHGMGIHLMRQAMDVVNFSCGNPGNIVRMVKWLSGSRFAASI